jgi:preprotein translocase subunit YajC
LIVIVAVFALLWLLLIRPQRTAAAKRQKLVESVDVGDEILTSGGMYGTVTGVGDETDELFVEVAEGVEVRIDRRSVGAIVRKDEEGAAEQDEVEDEPVAEAAADDGADTSVASERRYPS